MSKNLERINEIRGLLTDEENVELFESLLDEHDVLQLARSIKGFWHEDDIEELIAQLEG